MQLSKDASFQVRKGTWVGSRTVVNNAVCYDIPEHTQQRCNDLVFFFQAEDGIRDVAVTGVQTCALPISIWSWRSGSGRWFRKQRLHAPPEFAFATRARSPK